jgi:hypothetical protein
MKYLEIHSENTLTFDPEEYFHSPDLRHDASDKRRAMKGLYGNAIEELPLMH